MIYRCQFRGCERFTDCPLNRRLNVIEHSDPDENTGEPLYFAVCDEVDHTVTALTKQDLVPETPPSANAGASRPESPQAIGEIPVDEFWSRFNKEKNKAKIGAPSANDHAGNAYTQPQIAKMFGPPCTTQKVANWEAKARGANRGSTPPSAKYKGRLESYREDLRKFPIGENVEILAAIIEQYKATEGAKDAVGKIDKVHYRTPETLAKASGQVGAAIRERSQLKYEK